MPEQHLWSCDDHGNVYFLSSWEAGWRRLRARYGRQLRVKQIASCTWCMWAIAVDQSPYLFVPFDGTAIRVTEIIAQHERWDSSSGFSASNLTFKDPPEYQQVGCDGYSWTALPSTRWLWESSKWEYVLEHCEDRAGWEYSTSFSTDTVFSSFYGSDCVVRQRRWQCIRRFLGHDRWLLCSVSLGDLDSNNGSCRYLRTGIVHVHKLAIGGQAILHQPLGFLLLWAVTKDGRVICRTNIHRYNPEGSNWTEHHLIIAQDQNSNKSLPATNQPFAIDIHVNQYGQTLVLTDDNQLYYRTGVASSCPYGTLWIQVSCALPPLVAQEREHLASVVLGGRTVWLLANTGRAWFHDNLIGTTASDFLLLDSPGSWAPMTGLLAYLSVSPSDQVFALDVRSNCLIYRNGITSETPGGGVWLALELPILPSCNDRNKPDILMDQEGPLLPLCPPLGEAIQLVSRVLLCADLSPTDSTDESPERLSAPEVSDYDPSTMDPLLQIPSAHVLSHKLRRFFTHRNRSQINSFFVSFRHLLTKDTSDKKEDIMQLSEDHFLSKVGRPPARLTSLWAGALNSKAEPHLPPPWRIAALLSRNKDFIPYFSEDNSLRPPEWFLQIESALSPAFPNVILDGAEFDKAVANCEPWTESFVVDVLIPPNHVKDYNKATWVRRDAVIAHFASETHLEFSLVQSPSICWASALEGSAEVASASQITQSIAFKEIVWAGYIDLLSPLIPRNPRDSYTDSRRKFSDNAPIRKPGEEVPSKISIKASSLSSASTNFGGQLIAVFVREEKPLIINPSSATNITTDTAEHKEEEEEEEDQEKYPRLIKSHVVPSWVLRFHSKAQASSWLKAAQITVKAMPSTGKVWMVTEQAEIFWAVGASLDSLTWNRIGGHFARVDSISISDKDGSQVTWALGHNGTPWVHREDWTPASNPQFRFSHKHFPFSMPHVQTDDRQFRVYEFQVKRRIHGYTPSKAFDERSLVAQHQQPCRLSDIRLPSNEGLVHWLGDWEVDFSPLHGSELHHIPALWTSGGENWSLESPSIPSRHSADNELSVGSIEFDVMLSQHQPQITIVSSSNGTMSSSLPSPSAWNFAFKEGITYAGTGEGFAYSTPPSCDAKGWLRTSRSFPNSLQGQGSRSVSGVRYRRWVRSCSVSTEAPWQEVGPLKLKCVSLSRASSTSQRVDVWAVTNSGELVFRRNVTPSNPAGSAWLHYPTKRRLHFVAAAPESGRLWAVCVDFGLMWRWECEEESMQWSCLGFAPSGAAWHRLAPANMHCLWALDVDGRLWVHLESTSYSPAENASGGETEGWALANWVMVASPKVSDISCSPDGKVWAVFSSTNTLAVRMGISQRFPCGTGWLLAFAGIASSVCIKAASVLV